MAALALAVQTVGAVPAAPEVAGPALDDPRTLSPVIKHIATVAAGLRGPDGIALDPETGDVYVAMEDAAMIVRIRPDGIREAVFDSKTPLYAESSRGWMRVPGLTSPEGLAIDAKGQLYVVEDVPGGRLLVFNLRDPAVLRQPRGLVIPVPFDGRHFAWEAVDVGPAGELLLAGSSMEALLREFDLAGQIGIFRGVVLFRDAAGNWWWPLNHATASYSAAAFSADGAHAVFACEFSGDVGVLDLRSRQVRVARPEHVFRAPEGVCALPDGTAIVAEEGGGIYHLDPASGLVEPLADLATTIESVRWDAARRRLLVTDDRNGTLLALEWQTGCEFLPALGAPRSVPYADQFTSVEMIPVHCPPYLARVLRLGGFGASTNEPPVEFQDFARKYCIVAVDAEALALPHAHPIADPVARIQFVIVAPYLVGSRSGELLWSSSGFVAIHDSGAVVKTRLVQRDVAFGDLLECRFLPIGGKTIALPMPFSSRISPDGIATVHFMGMNVTADYLFILNTVAPNESFLLVMPPNERPQQYRLQLPRGQDSSYWVVGLERKTPEAWQPLPPRPPETAR